MAKLPSPGHLWYSASGISQRFAANRDLQYSALEYGLTILETGMTEENERHLSASLRRLSREDRQDILNPLLKQKLPTLPLPCLARGLKSAGSLIHAEHVFLQGLEILLSCNQPAYIRSALNIGFRHKVDPHWLATQLERYWPVWAQKNQSYVLWEWWRENPQYLETVLQIWPPPASYVHDLLNSVSSTRWYGSSTKEHSLIKLGKGPESLTDQLIVTLKCLSTLSELTDRRPSNAESFRR